MNMRPLSDRVVVEREKAETMTPGGIALPEVSREKPVKGVVLAIGPGRFDANGGRQPLQVKVGDRVLFSSYAGSEVKLDGERVLLLREDDIVAILE